MSKKNKIEAQHAVLYWQRIAKETSAAAVELSCLEALSAAGWNVKQQLVLDDLRQAGRLLMEAAESLIDEIAELKKAHDRP